MKGNTAEIKVRPLISIMWRRSNVHFLFTDERTSSLIFLMLIYFYFIFSSFIKDMIANFFCKDIPFQSASNVQLTLSVGHETTDINIFMKVLWFSIFSIPKSLFFSCLLFWCFATYRCCHFFSKTLFYIVKCMFFKL